MDRGGRDPPRPGHAVDAPTGPARARRDDVTGPAPALPRRLRVGRLGGVDTDTWTFMNTELYRAPAPAGGRRVGVPRRRHDAIGTGSVGVAASEVNDEQGLVARRPRHSCHAPLTPQTSRGVVAMAARTYDLPRNVIRTGRHSSQKYDVRGQARRRLTNRSAQEPSGASSSSRGRPGRSRRGADEPRESRRRTPWSRGRRGPRCRSRCARGSRRGLAGRPSR